MPEIDQSEIRILKARLEAYRSMMEICARDLLLVAEVLKEPNIILLQVINDLHKWSTKDWQT